LRQARYSAKDGFSLPLYVQEGSKDSVLALHLARYGDSEAANQLVEPGDTEISQQIQAARFEREYPVEWTRLVGLLLHSAQMRLAQHGHGQWQTEAGDQGERQPSLSAAFLLDLNSGGPLIGHFSQLHSRLGQQVGQGEIDRIAQARGERFVACLFDRQAWGTTARQRQRERQNRQAENMLFHARPLLVALIG
jgi:hypothetical protein